ncbi:hypothetical protein Tco_0984142 [Tanacetum coccineum]
MKAPADVAAEAAAESYVFVQAESEVEQKEDNATDFQRVETYDGQSSPVDNHPGGETVAEKSLETPGRRGGVMVAVMLVATNKPCFWWDHASGGAEVAES